MGLDRVFSVVLLVAAIVFAPWACARIVSPSSADRESSGQTDGQSDAFVEQELAVDLDGAADADFATAAPLAISPSTAYAPSGTHVQFKAVGGTGTFTFTLQAGNNGTVSPGGLLQTTGAGELTIRVTDGAGDTAQAKVFSFNLSDHPALGVWLSADTLMPLGDGGSIATWSDRSAQKNDVVQGMASQRPTLRHAALNGLPVVDFHGAQYLKHPSYLPALGAAPRSVIAVVTDIAPRGSRQPVCAWGGSNSFRNAFGLSVGSADGRHRMDSTFVVDVHSYDKAAASTTPMQQARPYLVVAHYDGEAIDQQVNGVWSGRKVEAINTASNVPLEVGAWHVSAPYVFYQGSIAELMVFEDASTGYPFEETLCYLSRKYNIPIEGSLDCGTGSVAFFHDGVVTVKAGEALSLNPRGGVAPYCYVLSGPGSIAPEGVYQAPSTPGSAHLRVEDSFGQSDELELRVVGFPQPATWLELSSTMFGDQGPVALISDVSGNRRHFSQRASSRQPVFVANGINAHPTLRFSGGQSLSNAWIAPGRVSARAFFAVVKGVSAGTIFSQGDDNYCGGQFALTVGTFFNVDTNCTVFTTSTSPASEPAILVADYDGATLRVFTNGEEVLSTTAPLVTDTVYGNKLGADFRGTVGFFHGEIAEFIAFDSHLSNAERMAVESYLSVKFGILLK
ncbi:MAG: hypothetical protein JRH20_08705 [Deltaproteobacteria bacterium]|nr:hypothetical protein [Deltaproteobacteria bacterium]